MIRGCLPIPSPPLFFNRGSNPAPLPARRISRPPFAQRLRAGIVKRADKKSHGFDLMAIKIIMTGLNADNWSND
ncbi:MAG: hypothetical protein METHAR1v1_960025 [Methanothrix sp.]|nr:MAG: hypothetical protein METHAR1v1_960025 [Methanothrix sp.]